MLAGRVLVSAPDSGRGMAEVHPLVVDQIAKEIFKRGSWRST